MQFFDGIKIIRIIKFNDIFKLKKLIFYFKTIEHQFSSATFHNIIISRKIADFCISNEVDFLHLTFEGNAFEEYTVFLLQGKKTQIRMHQFSLITSGHIGIHRFLLNDFSNLIIYCSGPIINDYLKKVKLKKHILHIKHLQLNVLFMINHLKHKYIKTQKY